MPPNRKGSHAIQVMLASACLLHITRLREHRQRQDEGAALALVTLDPHAPPMRRHDFLHNIETEAGTLGLGRVEGLENLCDVGGGNTASAIAHMQLHVPRQFLSPPGSRGCHLFASL